MYGYVLLMRSISSRRTSARSQCNQLGFGPQQRHEVGFKKTVEEPDINDKDWPRTLEKIKEYLASQYDVTGATLDYVVRPEIAVKPEAEDPPENYETVDQEMTARAPHARRPFVNDRRKVWDIMSNICGNILVFFTSNLL
jgi:hypothetical protein